MLCALNSKALANIKPISASALSDYHYILGEMASLEQKGDVALLQFNHSLNYDKKSTSLLLRRAQELFSQSLVDQALKEAKQLLSFFKNDSEEKLKTHLLLAQIYQSTRKIQLSINHYNAVLKIDSNHFQAHLQHALLSIEKGVIPHQASLDFLNNVADFHHYKGDIHLSKGNEGRAINSFRQALSIDTQHRKSTLRLFQIYKNKGQLEEFSRLVEKSSIKDSYISSLLVSAYLNKGESAKASRHMENVLWSSPLTNGI